MIKRQIVFKPFAIHRYTGDTARARINSRCISSAMTAIIGQAYRRNKWRYLRELSVTRDGVCFPFGNANLETSRVGINAHIAGRRTDDD